VRQEVAAEVRQEVAAEVRQEVAAEVHMASERATLVRQATKRFGLASPAHLAAIEKISDRARLEELLDRVLDAGSWDDLLQS
jgi:hypothetical protein